MLYDRIPKNHILKSINSAVDFSFINKQLESSYCKYYGRPAKEPEMMAKLLILQYLYNLPNRKECIKGNAVGNKLVIGLSTPTFYQYSQRQKTPEFLEKYKKRSSQEWKNGEMKRFHGIDRARGYGLKSMQTQAKLTALAVNLKRIASLVSSYFNNILYNLNLYIIS